MLRNLMAMTTMIAMFCFGTSQAAELLGGSPAVVPPCGCGCMTTGQCQCKNCCERTADPNWKPTAPPTIQVSEPAVTWQQVCDGKTCRWVQVQSQIPTVTPKVNRGWGQDDDPFRCNAGRTVCTPQGCFTVNGVSYQSAAPPVSSVPQQMPPAKTQGPVMKVITAPFKAVGRIFGGCKGCRGQ